MTPTETLKHEHQIILAVLGAAEREADSIHITGMVHGDEVRKMLDFLRNFADRCHHAKEEKLLFKKMVQRGFPAEYGPIAVMLSEHDEGRSFLRNIDRILPEALERDANALAGVAESLESYAELLRQHIDKEDTILYPMADNLLTPNDQTELEESFERVEREEMGEDTHEKYHALALELSQGNVLHVK